MTPGAGLEAAPRAQADLRLLGAAAGSWVGVLIGGRLLPIVSVCAVAAFLVCARPLRRRPAAIAGLVMLAAGLVVGGTGRMSRTSGPAVELAAREGAGRVELTISTDPQPLPAVAHLPPRVWIRAQLQRLTIGGRRWVLSQPVLVFAPAASWDRLLPSTRVAGSADFRRANGSDIAAVLVMHRAPAMIRGPSVLQRWAGRIRSGLRRAASGLGSSERGLLPGLVVGDTSAMPAADVADFRVAGLTHLTAVSGANLAVVIAAVFGSLRWLRLGIRSRAAVSAVVLLGFVVLARPSPSLLRAAAMGLLALLALALGRPRMMLPALLAAVTALALFSPAVSAQPGFVLSVLATLGLLVLAPGWAQRWRQRWPPRLGRFAPVLAVPVAAQAACAPVIAGVSGAISLSAVPANLLALPVVPLATVLGLLAAVLSPASPAAAHALCVAAGVVCSWLVTIAHAAAHIPSGALAVPKGALGVVLTAMVTAVAAIAVRTRAGRRTLALSAAFLCLAGALGAR